MGHEGIPRVVREALKRGDHDALSRMGHEGGIQAAQSRAVEKAERAEDLEKLRIAIAKLYSLSPDGDVLPPEDQDPVDGIVYH